MHALGQQKVPLLVALLFAAGDAGIMSATSNKYSPNDVDVCFFMTASFMDS